MKKVKKQSKRRGSKENDAVAIASPLIAANKLSKHQSQTNKKQKKTQTKKATAVFKDRVNVLDEIDKEVLALGKKSSKKQLSGKLVQLTRKKKPLKKSREVILSYEEETEAEEIEIAQNYLKMEFLKEVQNHLMGKLINLKQAQLQR